MPLRTSATSPTDCPFVTAFRPAAAEGRRWRLAGGRRRAGRQAAGRQSWTSGCVCDHGRPGAAACGGPGRSRQQTLYSKLISERELCTTCFMPERHAEAVILSTGQIYQAHRLDIKMHAVRLVPAHSLSQQALLRTGGGPICWLGRPIMPGGGMPPECMPPGCGPGNGAGPPWYICGRMPACMSSTAPSSSRQFTAAVQL